MSGYQPIAQTGYGPLNHGGSYKGDGTLPFNRWLSGGWTTVIWLVVLLIVIVIILWIICGGKDEEYIGPRPLIPGTRLSEVIDRDTMALLGIKNPQSVRSVHPYEPDEEEDNTYSSASEGNYSSEEEDLTSDEDEYLVVDRSDYSIRSVRVKKTGIDRRTPRFEELDLGTRSQRLRDQESLGERACRQFLERYYDEKFPRRRPDFIRNPVTGRNLELDCYNPELRIACEYNGKQHYVYPNYFHRTKQQFIAQVRRDQYKYESCVREGVYLITVPYTVPLRSVPRYIRERLPQISHE